MNILSNIQNTVECSKMFLLKEKVLVWMYEIIPFRALKRFELLKGFPAKIAIMD